MSSQRMLLLAARVWGMRTSRLDSVGDATQRFAAAAWPATQSSLNHTQVAGFASDGYLRHSSDQTLQTAEGGHPGPDDTNVSQKNPLAQDKEGKPQVGKMDTTDEGKGSDASAADAAPPEGGAEETEDVVPNLQTPKD